MNSGQVCGKRVISAVREHRGQVKRTGKGKIVEMRTTLILSQKLNFR